MMILSGEVPTKPATQAIMVTWTLENQGLYISLKIMRFL